MKKIWEKHIDFYINERNASTTYFYGEAGHVKAHYTDKLPYSP
ncbi:hypothetical protein SAMN05421766_103563 [Zobellia uliginosa]|uniref:Uncharacterized protein n=1 Tax=Zobellia uliginosa TaxID=143224 RepID=A0ABY1KW07_9FLAO|nr:hypothetical protein SAMN05421766_103563 [Zobellia uliginosa]